jgi:hypothetical protein
MDAKSIERWVPRQFPFDTVVVDSFRGFVSWSALRWLAIHGVSVVLHEFDGKPLLNAIPAGPANADARLSQYRAHLDSLEAKRDRGSVRPGESGQELRGARFLGEALSSLERSCARDSTNQGTARARGSGCDCVLARVLSVGEVRESTADRHTPACVRIMSS